MIATTPYPPDTLVAIQRYLFRRLDYTPHEGQARFHHCDARFKLLIAGSRFGKSLAAARDVLIDLLKRGTRGWIVAPSYRLGCIEFRYILQDLRKLGLPITKVIDGGERGASEIHLAWGSSVKVVSAAQPHNLLGEELDWLLLSEASQLEREIWTRYLRARLTTRRGRLLVPTTPKGFNWLHELFLRCHDPDHPEWQALQYTTSDNPLIPREEIKEARRTLPKREFEEQYEGAFTTRAGLVYPEFSPDSHVIDELPDLSGWQQIGGVDFGYENPFVCLFAARGNGNRLIVVDEYFASRCVIPAHADALDKRGARDYSVIFADPSGGSEMADLKQRGFPVRSAKNDVLYGIDKVRQRLLPGDDGRPGLLVHRRCQNLIREFTRYRYADELDKRGEARPIKQDDHCLDALRYICLMIDREVEWDLVG